MPNFKLFNEGWYSEVKSITLDLNPKDQCVPGIGDVLQLIIHHPKRTPEIYVPTGWQEVITRYLYSVFETELSGTSYLYPVFLFDSYHRDINYTVFLWPRK